MIPSRGGSESYCHPAKDAWNPLRYGTKVRTALIPVLLILASCGERDRTRVEYPSLLNEDGTTLPSKATVEIDEETNKVKLLTVDGIWVLGDRSNPTTESQCQIFDVENWSCEDRTGLTPSSTLINVWEAKGKTLTHRKRINSNGLETTTDLTVYIKK